MELFKMKTFLQEWNNITIEAPLNQNSPPRVTSLFNGVLMLNAFEHHKKEWFSAQELEGLNDQILLTIYGSSDWFKYPDRKKRLLANLWKNNLIQYERRGNKHWLKVRWSKEVINKAIKRYIDKTTNLNDIFKYIILFDKKRNLRLEKFLLKLLKEYVEDPRNKNVPVDLDLSLHGHMWKIFEYMKNIIKNRWPGFEALAKDCPLLMKEYIEEIVKVFGVGNIDEFGNNKNDTAIIAGLI
jgi:hypothetical protein